MIGTHGADALCFSLRIEAHSYGIEISTARQCMTLHILTNQPNDRNRQNETNCQRVVQRLFEPLLVQSFLLACRHQVHLWTGGVSINLVASKGPNNAK